MGLSVIRGFVVKPQSFIVPSRQPELFSTSARCATLSITKENKHILANYIIKNKYMTAACLVLIKGEKQGQENAFLSFSDLTRLVYLYNFVNTLIKVMLNSQTLKCQGKCHRTILYGEE